MVSIPVYPHTNLSPLKVTNSNIAFQKNASQGDIIEQIWIKCHFGKITIFRFRGYVPLCTLHFLVASLRAPVIFTVPGWFFTVPALILTVPAWFLTFHNDSAPLMSESFWHKSWRIVPHGTTTSPVSPTGSSPLAQNHVVFCLPC